MLILKDFAILCFWSCALSNELPKLTLLLTLNNRGALCSVCTDEKTHLVFIAVILCVPNVGNVFLRATLQKRTLRGLIIRPNDMYHNMQEINYTISNFVVNSSYTTCACPCDCYLNPLYVNYIYRLRYASINVVIWYGTRQTVQIRLRLDDRRGSAYRLQNYMQRSDEIH